jgi:methylenetetrahydrofolate dehydrogenase (NADP+) / methenyltetrahydrofolate cyclohydrolase
MRYIQGKDIANKILQQISEKIQTEKLTPKLAIIKVGSDEATDIYVKNKVGDAAKVGIQTEVFGFDQIEVDHLAKLILELNKRKDINGYIIQLPLKIRGDIKEILTQIDPIKDVDGLNPLSLGGLWQDRNDIGYVPATVLGVWEAIKYVALEENTGVEDGRVMNSYLKGKNVVIINDSLIVGRPLAALLLNFGSTISICHKFTKDIGKYTSNADILISATGRVGIINAEMIKNKSVLIDVGIKRVGGEIRGDIDETSVKKKASWLTPVPNGIGPLTRAMLLQNVADAYIRQNSTKIVSKYQDD